MKKYFIAALLFGFGDVRAADWRTTVYMGASNENIPAQFREKSDDNPQINSKTVRDSSNFEVNLVYSPVSMPFPSAKGINAFYITSSEWMFGVDYISAGIPIKLYKIDIGEVTEHHVSLLARRFFGNSFYHCCPIN
ncbi:MAG: hypothetical protein AABY83_07640 [Pseudomonadota bacterium]